MPTILLVDDNPSIRELFKACLTKDGYRVLTAEDGATAVGLAHRLKPALILLDVRMPGIDGFEVARRLKGSSATKDIPFAFLTVHSAREDVLQAKGLGAVDYILKTDHVDKVLEKIRRHAGPPPAPGEAPEPDPSEISDLSEKEIQEAAERFSLDPGDVEACVELLTGHENHEEPFTIRVGKDGEAIVFELVGLLSPAHRDGVLTEVDKRLSGAPRKLIIDVTFARGIIEGGGLDTLRKAVERAKSFKARVKVVSYNDEILDALRAVKFQTSCAVYRSRAEAQRAY